MHLSCSLPAGVPAQLSLRVQDPHTPLAPGSVYHPTIVLLLRPCPLTLAHDLPLGTSLPDCWAGSLRLNCVPHGCHPSPAVGYQAQGQDGVEGQGQWSRPGPRLHWPLSVAVAWGTDGIRSMSMPACDPGHHTNCHLFFLPHHMCLPGGLLRPHDPRAQPAPLLLCYCCLMTRTLRCCPGIQNKQEHRSTCCSPVPPRGRHGGSGRIQFPGSTPHPKHLASSLRPSES